MRNDLKKQTKFPSAFTTKPILVCKLNINIMKKLGDILPQNLQPK